ncbi:uncharacterized protein [Rutidosis leptorrhynchoides]|uniref:uncharacterized protein n=1 Tax=Rutidosis leptorrhynchoides TaxID=125765 RepID=UPI003A99DA8D
MHPFCCVLCCFSFAVMQVSTDYTKTITDTASKPTFQMVGGLTFYIDQQTELICEPCWSLISKILPDNHHKEIPPPVKALEEHILQIHYGSSYNKQTSKGDFTVDTENTGV